MSLLFQVKNNAACLEREDIREQNSKMQAEICDLKETLDRRLASDRIEVSLIMLNNSVHTFLYDYFVDLLQEINALTSLVDGRNNRLNNEACVCPSGGGVAGRGCLCH